MLDRQAYQEEDMALPGLKKIEKTENKAAYRNHCDFSCSERLCDTMDKIGVPREDKWRTLILYMRGLKDYNNNLTMKQRGQLQKLLLDLIRNKEFSNSRYDEVLQQNDSILYAPYIEKLEDAVDESEKLLMDFQQLMQKRRGDVNKVGRAAQIGIDQGRDPRKLISNLRVALHDLVSVMDSDVATLHHLAKTDGLTGLYNRRAFDEYLLKSVVMAQSNSRPLSLVLLDIDHFKKFNDTYGHRIGDQALTTVATIMKHFVKSFQLEDNTSFFPARYGGEEFVLVIPGSGPEEAGDYAEKLRKRIESYNFLIRNSNGKIVKESIRITASMGVAGISPTETASSVEELIDAADRALYEAKTNGRNRVNIWRDVSG